MNDIEDAMRAHLDKDHHPNLETMFPGVKPEQIVRSVVQMSEAVPGLLDVVYGPPTLDPATGRKIVMADGTTLRDTQKGLRYQLNNGGLRTTVRWSRTQWAVVGSAAIGILLRLFGVEIPT